MTPAEYREMKEQRASLNAKQEALRLQAIDLTAQAETARSNRKNIKAHVAEIDVKLQAYEREQVKPVRSPHPDKPNVLIERVEVPVEVPVLVEQPMTWGRALKKVFTGS